MSLLVDTAVTRCWKWMTHYWKAVAGKIHHAIRRQKFLMNQIKAERENLYRMARQPQFPSQLGWLARLWEQTRGVPHAPFDAQRHYSLTNVLRDIRALGVSKERLEGALKEEELSGIEIRRNGKNKTGRVMEAILSQVKELFVGFFEYTGNCAREWRRTMKWVDHQRDVPMARLRG